MSNLSKPYEVVTQRITEIIEKTGELPWRRPWRKSSQMLRGKNHVSGKSYNGINAFLTAIFTELQGFDSNEWVTFLQAKNLGGSVKKGERGIPCVFFNMVDLDKDDGEDLRKKAPFAKLSTIFNVSQCTGIEYASMDEVAFPAKQHEPILSAESIVAAYKDAPRVVNKVDFRAFYSPADDIVNVPEMGEFSEVEEYYAVLFHELVHSTGHRTRLNRKGIAEVAAFGSHEYSKEELIAEIGACFLALDSGFIGKTLDNSAAYIKGWLAALKANPMWLVSSANAAQRAVDYIRGVARVQGHE